MRTTNVLIQRSEDVGFTSFLVYARGGVWIDVHPSDVAAVRRLVTA